MLAKVISGGQTGVDQAALRAAKACGIPTGGFAPKGWLTEAGPAPWLADFGLVEHDSDAYPGRTRANVLESRWTLWLGDPSSPGGRLTAKMCHLHDRPMTVISLDTATPAVALTLLRRLTATDVLNVAGNRESKSPGIGEKAEAFLREVFAALATGV